MESQKKAKLIKLILALEGENKQKQKPKKLSLEEAKHQLRSKDLNIDISTMLQELNYGKRDEALIGAFYDNLLTPLLLKLISRD